MVALAYTEPISILEKNFLFDGLGPAGFDRWRKRAKAHALTPLRVAILE